ncbi:cupin domain-containing protein [Chromobacterium haemolyticum]|uniref:cupin domain-containing protein n=1 Tax=Chromobacterium TaxID=535 RepID=UPI0040572BC8
MKQISDIIVFQRHEAAEQSFAAPEAVRIVGECRQSVVNHYSDPSGRFHCGMWSGGLGHWKVRYKEDEFCSLLKGRVRIYDEAGQSVELMPGEHFVIPAGFVGTWQVLEPACKTYAVFEPPQWRE